MNIQDQDQGWNNRAGPNGVGVREPTTREWKQEKQPTTGSLLQEVLSQSNAGELTLWWEQEKAS